MKNIPEINHCIPNPRAYWCRFCKAHNTFEYFRHDLWVQADFNTDGDDKPGREHHLCKACRGASGLKAWSAMFNPSEMITARKWILVAAGSLIVVGGVAELYAPGAVGPLLACAVIGAVLGLFALLANYWLREFSAWASAQRRKSPEELRQEALDHPFQPEYDNSTDFTYWAEQFLSSEEVEQLHEKYGGGGEEESPLDPRASWFQGEEDS